MKRALTLLLTFCSTAVALAIFTLIVLFGYSRFVRPPRHVQAATTIPVCDEGPILTPFRKSKSVEPKIFTRVFPVGIGGSFHLWDPPDMKPQKIEISAGWPLQIADSNCKASWNDKVWLCSFQLER